MQAELLPLFVLTTTTSLLNSEKKQHYFGICFDIPTYEPVSCQHVNVQTCTCTGILIIYMEYFEVIFT